MSVGQRISRRRRRMAAEQRERRIEPLCVLVEVGATLGHRSYKYYVPRPTPSLRSLRLRWLSRSGCARATRAADAATLTALRLRLMGNQVGKADLGLTAAPTTNRYLLPMAIIERGFPASGSSARTRKHRLRGNRQGRPCGAALRAGAVAPPLTEPRPCVEGGGYVGGADNPEDFERSPMWVR